ncbi:hypothetical protein [Litchfieldia salsa]|uniref:Uncharacterized protein n=1 Tax=Litchfieldia salsa TaxID=930152 RepID=A0A1H0WCG8_9BACI|nr:hypothetical protein [Litchfieldia salsa]SDP88450.1 hypothetical protein SAMN05216565_110109 [Litchfieldia salsa]
MNIYQKYAKYVIDKLKTQKELQIQDTDFIYLCNEINELTIKVRKSSPGWLQVTLIDY